MPSFDTTLQPASATHQKMFLDAQNTLELTPIEQATLYKLDPKKPNRKNLGGCAYCVKNGFSLQRIVEIKEDSFENLVLPHGCQKFIALHEASHIKQYDYEKSVFVACLITSLLILYLMLSFMGIYTIVSYIITTPIKVITIPLRLLLTGIFFKIIMVSTWSLVDTAMLKVKDYKKTRARSCEYHADMTAAQAIQCKTCLYNFIRLRKRDEKSKTVGPILLDEGYASSQELEALNKNNKDIYCTYHSSKLRRGIDCFKRAVFL